MFKEEISKVLSSFEEEIDSFSKLIVRTVIDGGHIWLVGNGGSASTAEHFEIDLLRIKLSPLPFPMRVTSLTANSSVISAIVNDLGAEHIFSKQLERKSAEGDLVLLISASGNSPNLLSAYEICKLRRLACVAMVGFDGGRLGGLVKNKLHVKTDNGDYALVENIHLAVCHEISERVHKALSELTVS